MLDKYLNPANAFGAMRRISGPSIGSSMLPNTRLDGERCFAGKQRAFSLCNHRHRLTHVASVYS